MASWWTSWIGRKIGLQDHDFWTQWSGSATWAGKSVTPDTALMVSAFWACVRLNAQTVGSLPTGLYIKKDDGSREVLKDHPVYNIIHNQPNADQTAIEFWEGMDAQLSVWGNAYAEIIRNSGRITSLEILKSAGMKVSRNKDTGFLEYEYYEEGKTRKIAEENVLHVRGFGFGGIVGLSPLAYARQSLASSLATEEASARTFANGMRPGGFFTYDKTLSPEQRAQAKKVLIDPYAGAENAGKVGILEAGFKWQDVAMPPEDAQMFQQRGFNVEDVCRWMGTPPILIGHASQGQTMWGSGVEQIIIGWLTLGLRPRFIRIEQAIKRCLLTPEERRKGIYPEINFEGLLRADSAARASYYSQMVQNGIMTRRDVRDKENLPHMAGDDILTVQSNLVPLDKLGEAAGASSDQARNAIREWLLSDEEKSQRPRLEIVK